jgi:hypothetical protein
MTVFPYRSLRALAAVFCSIGAVIGADDRSGTWTLVAVAAFSSALMLQALVSGGVPGSLKLQAASPR